MTQETRTDNKDISNKALYRKIKANKYQHWDFNMVYGKNANGKVIEGYNRDVDESEEKFLIGKNEEFINFHLKKLQKTLNALKLKILKKLNARKSKKKFTIIKFLDDCWVDEVLIKNVIWKSKYEKLNRKMNLLKGKINQDS